jgi:hypothetical protein
MNKSIAIISTLFIICICFKSIGQSDIQANKKTQSISEARLKNAKIVEDLIALFPAELEIVSCRISIVGKDIKYSEHVLSDHTLPDFIKNVRSEQWMYIEYILFKKKGSPSNAVGAYDPIELIVTDGK